MVTTANNGSQAELEPGDILVYGECLLVVNDGAISDTDSVNLF